MAHLAAPRARGFLTLALASVFDGVLFLVAPQYLVHDVCVCGCVLIKYSYTSPSTIVSRAIRGGVGMLYEGNLFTWILVFAEFGKVVLSPGR